MLNNPLGIFLLLIFAVYWAIFIFRPANPKSLEAPANEKEAKPLPAKSIIALVVFFIFATVLSAGTFATILLDFERSPGGTVVLIAGLSALLLLLLFKPERFMMLLVVAVVVFGLTSLMTRNSTTLRTDENPYYRR